MKKNKKKKKRGYKSNLRELKTTELNYLGAKVDGCIIELDKEGKINLPGLTFHPLIISKKPRGYVMHLNGKPILNIGYGLLHKGREEIKEIVLEAIEKGKSKE